MRRAALALFVLAPWAAECSWGGFTAVDFPFVVLFLAPMYGGAALLIREAARRTGGGWPMIVLLAAAYGVFQVSFVDQALFNVDFLDDTQFAANAVGARRTWVPGLEFSVAQLLSYVGNHVVLTVCVPIAIVETFVSPERRHRPWLRWPGLLVTAILFVLGCWIVFADTSKGFVASPLQRAVAAGVVVALAVAAVRLPRRSPGRSDARPPRPLWIVLVVVAARLTDDQVPGWWGVALMVAATAVAGGLILWWSGRPGWTQGHVLAAASTSLLLAATLAWVVPTYEPSSTLAAVTGDLAMTVVALALVGGAWWRLRRYTTLDPVRVPRP
ncbi:hypothetical protein [Virgisporangium aurantiacum]|uniref:Uncharacterized protein n=1 Tax=Virgisporangium aurantiacum TaxID=175570 RepID=A0A8J3Z304_9ACTN|nr:hypothetical protein [Virgisporangium aurantiacum]GIJ55757.1 hypothetical protein Vau01_032730 [Virgisporangium aurantiacum]